MPVKVPEWTDVDARLLRTFLQSRAGGKLGTMLRALIVREAQGAIHAEAEKLSWRCGHASGVQTAVETIDALARWETAEAPKDDRPTDDLSWLHDDHGTDDDRND